MEGTTATLDDVKDLRKNIGFHFTPKQNLESILKTGLVPRFGRNSSGALGQSAIPKTYISYGLEGVLQLYNRLLNLPLEGELENFQDIDHKAFLPESVAGNNPDYKLNVLESFEFIRQYMENNVYLMFDAPMSEHEHTLSELELSQLNQVIRSLENEDGVNIYDRVDFLNDEIKRMSNDRENDNSAQKLAYIQERNKLAIEVWNRTKGYVQQKQGALINGELPLVIDKIDYNDERLCWTNFGQNPHNTHTRILEQDGKLTGEQITSKALRIFSEDGTTQANGIQFFEQMYSRVLDTDLTNLQNAKVVDVNLLEQFSKYVRLVEQYKQFGLLVERPSKTFVDGNETITFDSSLVVDLTNISKYPGLAEFAQESQTIYEEERKRSSDLRKELKGKQNKNLSKELAKTFAGDNLVALLHDQAAKKFSVLDSQQEKTEDEIIQGED